MRSDDFLKTKQPVIFLFVDLFVSHVLYDEYEQLGAKIVVAVLNQNIVPCDLTVFSEIDRKNHPIILKVLFYSVGHWQLGFRLVPTCI